MCPTRCPARPFACGLILARAWRCTRDSLSPGPHHLAARPRSRRLESNLCALRQGTSPHTVPNGRHGGESTVDPSAPSPRTQVRRSGTAWSAARHSVREQNRAPLATLTQASRMRSPPPAGGALASTSTVGSPSSLQTLPSTQARPRCPRRRPYSPAPSLNLAATPFRTSTTAPPAGRRTTQSDARLKRPAARTPAVPATSLARCCPRAAQLARCAARPPCAPPSTSTAAGGPEIFVGAARSHKACDSRYGYHYLLRARCCNREQESGGAEAERRRSRLVE